MKYRWVFGLGAWALAATGLVTTSACFPDIGFDDPSAGTGGTGATGGQNTTGTDTGTGTGTGPSTGTGTGGTGTDTGMTGGAGGTGTSTGSGGAPPMVQVPCTDVNVGQTLCATGEACCYDWFGPPFDDQCLPPLQCPAESAPITCANSKDCTGSDVCCGLYNAGQDIFDSVLCLPQCADPDIQFCDPNGVACPSGSCLEALGAYPGYYWCV